MADEDENICMPVDDRDYVAEDSDEDDNDIGRGENENMDDLGEDESDEEVNNDDDDDDDDDHNGDSGFEGVADKFICTFSSGDYDAELDDKLSYDRGLVLPNTQPTQSSYNKPDNWQERNRIGLEKNICQLQTCTRRMTNHGKSFELELSHNPYDQLLDNEEPIVWYEPVLDDYWAEVFHHMRQLEIIPDISGIYIENVEMKKEHLAALVDIFCSRGAANSCKVVIFRNANICGEGIVCLSKLVDVSSELQCFCLRHNPIDNMDSARYLSRSLKSHTRINNIHLDHCDLGSNPKMLSVILQSEIKIIYLGSNNIGSLGAVKIAEYLETDPPIYRIGLNCNRLNDDDAILISQALKRNRNLSHLHLERNNITSIGVKALLTCVFDGSSLNSISESNHILVRMNLFFSGRKSDNLDGCIDGMLTLDRTQKIVIALQDKDSLLKYLANVPVELIPEVLAFFLQHVDDLFVGQHEHLTIVYSTMRWWNMPMLYSYRSCVKSDTKRQRSD
jgi:hypothetical protein